MRKALTSLALALSPTRTPALTPARTVFSLDVRALALFRAGIGALLGLDTLMRWRDIRAHYADAGVMPLDVSHGEFLNSLHVSLHMANGSVAWQHLLFAVTLAASLAVLAGWRTRAATVVAWVMLVSVQNRNPMVLNGGDVLLRLLFFWAMFLPLGRVWSVDAALDDGAGRAAEPKLHFGGGTIAFVLQIALVYWATIALKTGKEWWPDGTASYFALNLDQFTTGFGRWLLNFPAMLKGCTYIVYFLEAAAGFLVVCPVYFTPVRVATIAALMFMHLNFDLAMRLGIFPWVDIVSLVPLLPSALFDVLAALGRTPPRRRLTVFYANESARKVALVVQEMFLVEGVKVEAAVHAEMSSNSASQIFSVSAADRPAGLQTTEALKYRSSELGQVLVGVTAVEKPLFWEVRTSDGRTFEGWAAVVTVFEHAPLFAWLVRRLPLRGLAPLLNPFLRGASPQKNAAVAAAHPRRPLEEPWIVSFLAFLAIGYCALWNLKTIPWVKFDMTPPWSDIGPVLRLDQKWNMFAPYPLKDDGWYVIDGALRDGTKVDVLSGEERAVSWDKPAQVAEQYPNARWRKYMMNIWQRSKAGYRLYFGRWVCRNWNSKRDGDQRLATFDIVFMRERTPDPGGEFKVDKNVIWSHDCFGKEPAPVTSADPAD